MQGSGIVHHCGASSTTDADRIRNNLLQQRHFIRFITQTLKPFEISLAKIFLCAGLLMRMIGGALTYLAGFQKNSFLFRSSIARLSDLIYRGDPVENRN
jgi:hypothetical protein